MTPKRVRIKIGDVFAVKLDEESKKHFQYVADDATQLSSNVIRAFSKAYRINDTPDLRDIVNDRVDFYTHVFIKLGLKLDFWEKVGNCEEIGEVNVLFRDCGEIDHRVKISNNWWIWKINEPQKYIGKLEGAYQKAEIGMVFAPPKIAQRMKTGKYDLVYPGF